MISETVSMICAVPTCRGLFERISGSRKIYCSIKCYKEARKLSDRHRCYCELRLVDGKCPADCPPEADPEHLARIDAKIRANEEHRRHEDYWTITAEETKRMNAAIAKFDPFYRHDRKRGRKAARTRHGIRVAKKKAS